MECNPVIVCLWAGPYPTLAAPICTLYITMEYNHFVPITLTGGSTCVGIAWPTFFRVSIQASSHHPIKEDSDQLITTQ